MFSVTCEALMFCGREARRAGPRGEVFRTGGARSRPWVGGKARARGGWLRAWRIFCIRVRLWSSILPGKEKARASGFEAGPNEATCPVVHGRGIFRERTEGPADLQRRLDAAVRDERGEMRVLRVVLRVLLRGCAGPQCHGRCWLEARGALAGRKGRAR